jgi:catechol 2,3-dioxygenase
MGLAWDPTPARGRINHFAYYVETTDMLLRAADVLINAGTEIEFGPGKHGMGEQGYLYAREPSGLRVELNAGGWRNYEPDLPTIRYEPERGSNVMYRNLAMPHSMLENFPPMEMSAEETAGAAQTTGLFV